MEISQTTIRDANVPSYDRILVNAPIWNDLDSELPKQHNYQLPSSRFRLMAPSGAEQIPALIPLSQRVFSVTSVEST
jgi:hypothetical protein